MQTTLTPQNWIDALRCLTPITGMVHVGAGNGSAAALYGEWNVPAAVFIEAEESQHDKLASLTHGRPGWSIHTALVSGEDGESDFYQATNPSESGLIAPEKLNNLWRNLKTKEHSRLKTQKLESLLAASNTPPESLNWATIDCLPALPIIQGAGKYLDQWDIIIARVILDEKVLPGNGASKSELDAFLAPHGYRCIATQEERQPAIGSAIYVRDWKASLNTRIAEQTRLATERQQQIEQLTKARDEQGKLASERQAQLEQISKAKEEQTRLATERQQQIEQLTKARDEQAKLAQTRQAHTTQLEAQLAEVDARQRMMNEEMIKAEGQIDLIKDILLREPGL